ncbi:MAG: polysaccharide biosynthesis tyrosine autokinase [bacterium]
MYTDFYGFTNLPFNNTPDPDFFFMSTGHQRALLFLLYAIREKKGLITVAGKPGTGKTALLHVIQREIGQMVKMIFFLNTGAEFNILLGHLLQKIGVCGSDSSKDNFELLREGLLYQVQQGISVVLVVDEAQSLDWQQLEQIRLLLNLETSDQKLLQIVLVGQPELQSKLNQPTVQQLKQRIDLSCRIDPLNELESFQYVEYRLRRAGRDQQDIFSYEAVQEVHRRAQGIPRLINNLCDKALLLGFTRQQHFIDYDIIRELSLLFENPQGNPAQKAIVQNDWNRPPTARLHEMPDTSGTYGDEKEDQLKITGREYQIINTGTRIHPLPPLGDEVFRFLHEGLRTVLGRNQVQGHPRRKWEPGANVQEEPFSTRGRLPRNLPDSEEQPQISFKGDAQAGGIPGRKEETPRSLSEDTPKVSKGAAPTVKNRNANGLINRKSLSPEYIRQIESLNIFSSGAREGGLLRGCLSFFPNLIIRSARRLIGKKPLSLPSKVLEEYQKIKNNLFLANPSNKIQTLVFASSKPGEGTSTVAINFAITFALTEEVKVLLVDTNFRSPKLHRFFGLSKAEGMSEIILGKIGWKDCLRSCKVPNLSIITAGEIVGNPAHLLKCAVLERTVQEFQEHFDHILFDTSAVSANSDALLLGSQMDGLVLVVQAGKTRMEIVRKTKNALNGAVPILGVVLNRRNYYIPDAIYRRL